MGKILTVGDLRKIIDKLPNDMPIYYTDKNFPGINTEEFPIIQDFVVQVNPAGLIINHPFAEELD